jgi:hypothetical protein
MAYVCIMRHKGYIKSKVHFPYQHNMRTLNNYSNKNIKKSNTYYNSIIENNLLEGETFLKAFNRLYKSGAFKGQLKTQGNVDKQPKFVDEFLVYPPFEIIDKMTLYEQDRFFQDVVTALHKYFPHMYILNAVVHRDEVFHPLDKDMKALFPQVR